MQSVEAIFSHFKTLNVMIVGDVMIDRYIHGKVSRISPEAPVPIVEYKYSENRLGGAANVALNIKALGATPYLFSIIGEDTEGVLFLKLLNDNKLSHQGISLSKERQTTVKTRIVAGNQQLLRIDTETTDDIDKKLITPFCKAIQTFLNTNKIDVIIFQDYNKGILTPKIIESVLLEATKRGIPTVVDPKKKNFFTYKGVTLFKPNLKEIRDAVPFEVQANAVSLQKAADYLRQKVNQSLTMITLSEKGLYLEENTEGGAIYPTQTRSVADVSGAGDTVVSIAALGLASALSLKDMAMLSNMAGGQVCQVSGVVPVDIEKLKKMMYDVQC